MAKLVIAIVLITLLIVVLAGAGMGGPAGQSLVAAAERIEIRRVQATDWADQLPECDLWCVIDALPEVQ